jgi:hypothetical protein
LHSPSGNSMRSMITERQISLYLRALGLLTWIQMSPRVTLPSPGSRLSLICHSGHYPAMVQILDSFRFEMGEWTATGICSPFALPFMVRFEHHRAANVWDMVPGWL